MVAERIHGRAALRDSVLPHRTHTATSCLIILLINNSNNNNKTIPSSSSPLPSPSSSRQLDSARESADYQLLHTIHLCFAFNVLKFSALLDSSRVESSRHDLARTARAYLSSQSRAPRDGARGGGGRGKMRGKT